MDTPSPDQPRRQSPEEPGKQPYLEWYRLALLLTGVPSVAESIVEEAAAAASGQLAQLRNQNARQTWLVRLVRERALRWQNAQADAAAPFRNQRVDEGVAPVSRTGESGGLSQSDPGVPPVQTALIWEKVAALPEPDRSAFALFHCLESDPDALAEMLGLRESAFADALGRARQALAPGQLFPESSKLNVYRPWGGNPARLQKLANGAKSDLKFAGQIAFDSRCHDEIERIAFPETLSLPEMAVPRAPGFRALISQPAVLAIGLAMLVVLGVTIFYFMRKLDEFPGKDIVAELIDATDKMNDMELEPIKPIEAGKLEDWFVLKGFENFAVPPELAKAKAIACRVYKHDGVPVAQVALDRHNALLMVFDASDMKVTLNTPAWHVFQQEDWAVAVRGDADNCYIVAFVGDSDDMAGFLKSGGME
ncbi:MAG: hypothetical protein WCP06_04075 [Verrucomicrobiota bacterium]